MILNESEIEQTALDLLKELNGYQVAYGPDLADGIYKERDLTDVLLTRRVKDAIDRINPHVPASAREDAFKQVLRLPVGQLIDKNEYFHDLLINGVDVKFGVGDGKSRTDKVWLIDWKDPEGPNNEFLAVNQFTLVDTSGIHTSIQENRRPDIVLFVNGFPLIVFELKNAVDEQANLEKAFNQLLTYHTVIPSLFPYNTFEVISDGWSAAAGTISSDYNRFMQWKSVDGNLVVDSGRESELQPLIQGMLNKHTLLDLVRHFLVFERTREGTIKKLAAYHQYFAVNKAIDSTLRASAQVEGKLYARHHPADYGLPSVHEQQSGDKRGGVVWHTQGSGKSLSMVFYAGKLVLEPAMSNPTIVVLTDRNDLDQQLFDTFAACQQLLRQAPVQAESREHLRELLQVVSGGIVFTTIQKFFPENGDQAFPTLTERRNVVVIADEAHRSQYDFIDGFARHMRDALPNATFIGFTGTPIEKEDKNTQAVFGNYVDIYDIQQAVEDGATVPIYYESRLAKISLSEADQKVLDQRIDEIAENEELSDKQKNYAKWASKEAVVGSAPRLRQVAADIVGHFEARRVSTGGKGMIVCMSRRICVELYDEIVRLRPDWHHPADAEGKIKIVMTGSASDPVEWQEHIRNKERRKQIGYRRRNDQDDLQLLIVRDMFLTGFDAPPLDTMYIDKPMNGHTLMQAIARVNRVFGEKTGGLIVDYIGIAQDLKTALAVYTEGQGRGEIALDQEAAVKIMLREFEIVRDMFGRFEYRRYFTLPPAQKLNFILDAANHIASLSDIQQGDKLLTGTDRFKENLLRLRKAYGLAVPHPKALEIRDDLAFFLAIKARFEKFERSGQKRTYSQIEAEIRRIVNDAIISEEVVDIFDAVGIRKPDISILSDEFLAEIQGMEHKNIALELLKKLLADEIKIRGRMNVTQERKFSEILAEAVKRYQNGLIDSVRMIEELIQLAQEIRQADQRGEDLGLQPDELAFYDALADNPNAETLLGDDILRQIAVELTESVRKNATIDWQLKESVQAKLRVLVKRLLRKYKYPPDDPATREYTVSVNKVLDQASKLADYWTG